MANEDNNKRNMRIWNILEDMPADKDVCRAMRQCVKIGEHRRSRRGASCMWTVAIQCICLTEPCGWWPQPVLSPLLNPLTAISLCDLSHCPVSVGAVGTACRLRDQGVCRTPRPRVAVWGYLLCSAPASLHPMHVWGACLTHCWAQGGSNQWAGAPGWVGGSLCGQGCWAGRGAVTYSSEGGGCASAGDVPGIRCVSLQQGLLALPLGYGTMWSVLGRAPTARPERALSQGWGMDWLLITCLWQGWNYKLKVSEIVFSRDAGFNSKACSRNCLSDQGFSSQIPCLGCKMKYSIVSLTLSGQKNAP